MNKPSLRARLTIWFAASILLILAPVLVGVVAMQWRAMRVALDHHITEDMEVAVEFLEADERGVRWRADSERDLGYDAGTQRWVEVYQDGRPLFLRGVPRAAAVRDALGLPSIQTDGYRTVRTPAGAYVRTLTVQRQIAGAPAWIRVARSEDELRREVKQLLALFALGAPLAVLVAALAGYVVSGRMLAPLGVMADRAHSINADQLSHRLPVDNADDELGQLAVVFNETFTRLEGSFDRLKQFTADASHELRTPLTAIRSVGEVGLREAKTPVEYREVIGSMLEEAGRLTTVVETLLTLSRWESGRVRPEPRPIDLREVAERAVAQLHVLAEDRGVTITMSLDQPLAVVADPVMVRQAVTNVLDNAIKFTPAGRRVTVSGFSDAHEQHLVVDDEGPGIPAEHRERVVERFYRVESTREGDRPGAGLGLAIVHRAMSANRGRVTIGDNTAGGTRVSLSLPRPAEAATA